MTTFEPQTTVLEKVNERLTLTDIHTHHAGRHDALLSLSPAEAMAGCATPYSLSLHPWWLQSAGQGKLLMADFAEAALALRGDPQLRAIGECGLDNKCAAPLTLQLEAFHLALNTARSLHLPVIIHCVGYWAEMIQSCRQQGMYADPACRLIVHGFRKGPQLARQLLDAGFDLSLGEKYNPEVARIVPPSRLWYETDESEVDIQTIRQNIQTLFVGR